MNLESQIKFHEANLVSARKIIQKDMETLYPWYQKILRSPLIPSSAFLISLFLKRNRQSKKVNLTSAHNYSLLKINGVAKVNNVFKAFS